MIQYCPTHTNNQRGRKYFVCHASLLIKKERPETPSPEVPSHSSF